MNILFRNFATVFINKVTFKFLSPLELNSVFQNKSYFILLLFLIIVLINLFLAALGLHCCVQTSSSCGGGLLMVAAPLVGEQGLLSTGSIVVAQVLTRSLACGIFQIRDPTHDSGIVRWIPYF